MRLVEYLLKSSEIFKVPVLKIAIANKPQQNINMHRETETDDTLRQMQEEQLQIMEKLTEINNKPPLTPKTPSKFILTKSLFN